MIYVRRVSGLLQPFDPPELTLEAAADRGWSTGPGGHLLEPAEAEGPWLRTYPLPGFEVPIEVDPPWLRELVYGAPWGPLTWGLPDV